MDVLGGGPAGLAAAWYASRRGLDVTVWEREADVGGLCRTFVDGAHRYDAGAHRLHDRDARVTADVRALLGDRLHAVDAPSCIHDGHRAVDFPPTPLAMLTARGLRDAPRIALDLVRARRRASPCVSFADVAVARFGETLARRYLINYSEKLWGLPAEQLAPDVATRRLSGMTLRTLVAELVAPRRKTRHIDGRFLYPRHGYGEIPAALAAALPAGTVRTGRTVVGLRCHGGRIARIELAGGDGVDVGGRVLCTLPLTLAVRLLGDAVDDDARRAAAGLRFRSVRLVFVRLGRPRVSAYASVYVPDPRLVVARVSEPKARSTAMGPAHETGLVVEVPCFPGDAVATMPEATLVARVVDELAGLGLCMPSEVLGARHHLLAHAYPVYALGWERQVARVVAGLGAVRNLDLLGRGGTFFYSHLHDQLGLARAWASSLAGDGDAAIAVAAPV